MDWYNVRGGWLTDATESFAKRMGVVPVAGTVVYHGDPNARGQRSARVWIIADEGLLRFDFSPGERTPSTDNPATYSLTGSLTNWGAAPTLTVTADDTWSDGARKKRVSYQIETGDQDMLPSDGEAQEARARQFASEYWKRSQATSTTSA